ncbi:hypothetical protein [Clostridium sp.]|uniref:hypothetical protein n=1 Tax=Clostridium sp. TaxID=1506 RepID=UPI0025C12E2D|nr:hypothetical protein [Clostridium sp.]
MKLFKVYVIDDTVEYLELVVAKNKQEAMNIVKNLEQWSCIVYMSVEEVKEVDGYKIILQPIDIEED